MKAVVKLRSSWSLLVAVAVAAVAFGLPARAAVIADSVVTVEVASGTIRVTTTVEDEVGGDSNLWLFQYLLEGNYEPLPPESNGISSLQILFGGPMPDVTDQSVDWEQNASGVEPPFGVGWDLPNSLGFGVGPNGGALFSFVVPAGTPYTREASGSYASSHYFDTPFGLVSLVDDASGEGPIVPVPEPTSLMLIAGGLALLTRTRV